MPCDDIAEGGAPAICRGGSGLLLPLGGAWENDLNDNIRAVLYLLGLFYCFFGVAIIADIFMGAIERITSKKVLRYDKKLGRKRTMTVWNATVANLTLMALGSSAPEILLNVIGIFSKKFEASELGPSTIVGSAAFNLLIILAVCVLSIPNQQTRRIRDMSVYSITAFFSVFAYLWLLVILMGTSPNVVEVWEGLLTFAFFWVLICFAYAADKGLIPGTKKSADEGLTVVKGASREELEELKKQVVAKYNIANVDAVSPEDMKALIEADYFKGHSRATHRVNATRRLVGGRKALKHTEDPYELRSKVLQRTSSVGHHDMPMVAFACIRHTIMENTGYANIKVTCLPAPTKKTVVTYSTRDGKAKEGKDYKPLHKKELVFKPGIEEQTFTVEIIKSPGALKEVQEFYIDLEQEGAEAASSYNLCGTMTTATVVVIDEDKAGLIAFDQEMMTIKHDEPKLQVTVRRRDGKTGRVTCKWRTEEDSAKEGKDFEKGEGELVFEDQVEVATLEVKMGEASESYEKDEMFRIILEEATGGAAFDNTTDGGKDTAILTVTILSNKTTSGHFDKWMQHFSPNRDEIELGNESWKDQFREAIFVGGSHEEQKQASWMEWTLHMMNMPWKLLFACVPPTQFGGGWVCFFIALIMIGGVTIIIGDMAELLGCVVGISEGTTAITLVALGTSLPDTFASRTAARMDPYADNSIGNVTGSNSVNVFLGLGLPWGIAAIYWTFVAECEAGDNWSIKYPEQAKLYPKGAFAVESGSLGTSVLVFCCCACLCLATLAGRRQVLGGELGGPKFGAVATASFFALLWATYIVVSILSE